MNRARRTRSRSRSIFAELQGTWRSHEYGLLLEIGPTTYRLYEETSVSCLFVLEDSHAELDEIYTDVEVSPQRKAFSARRATGVTRIKYRRLASPPTAWVSADPAGPANPLYTFDVLWHTFAERYALFDLRGVDWQAMRERHRPLVDENTSAKRLFAVFTEMLRPLRDGHVELRASLGHFNAGEIPAAQMRLAAELDDPSNLYAALTLLQQRKKQRRAVVRRRYLCGPSRRAGHGLLEWGRLDEKTGYLVVRAMAGQSGEIGHARADQESSAAAMERALDDIGDLPFMVVDLRANGGGYDGVALRIAGYFIDRKRLAFSKAARKHERYGGRQDVYIEPRGNRRYAGQVFLLTSGFTASAAEIFVLALLQHPRLTRIGEATQGILSDVMERHLPNGWSLTLSNELYTAPDGTLYEDRGIPPHVEMDYLVPSATHSDPMLDYVLRETS